MRSALVKNPALSSPRAKAEARSIRLKSRVDRVERRSRVCAVRALGPCLGCTCGMSVAGPGQICDGRQSLPAPVLTARRPAQLTFPTTSS
jgi:hypothetical protein